jgi:hypothetical protein
MIALTIDTDWASEELVRQTVEMIHAYGCKVTAFCTDALSTEADEVALHPNFVDLDLETPIRHLKDVFPNAIGMRSHSLFFTERFRPIYDAQKLIYDSNAIQYLRRGIRCAAISTLTMSIPIYFMDRFHLEMAAAKADRFSVSQFDWDDDGLKVFDFHPIHVAMNTSSVEWYERHKIHYHNLDRLRECVAPGEGICTLLEKLLSYIRAQGMKTYTMSEVESAFHSQVFGEKKP